MVPAISVHSLRLITGIQNPRSSEGAMTQDQWIAVDRYITDLLVPLDPVLDAALQASAVAGLPPHNVSPNQGKLLLLLAQVIKIHWQW